MDLPQMRARVRQDLHDEDSENYRWTDDELDRHIQHAVRELSLAVPQEAKATLTTTAGSRGLSVTSLSDLVSVEAVEYPVDKYPLYTCPLACGEATLRFWWRMSPTMVRTFTSTMVSSTHWMPPVLPFRLALKTWWL